jgi:hypothetical protein
VASTGRCGFGRPPPHSPWRRCKRTPGRFTEWRCPQTLTWQPAAASVRRCGRGVRVAVFTHGHLHERGSPPGPVIGVPTITLAARRTAPRPDPSVIGKKFSGRYEYRTLAGGIAHKLPQEAAEPSPKPLLRLPVGRRSTNKRKELLITCTSSTRLWPSCSCTAHLLIRPAGRV